MPRGQSGLAPVIIIVIIAVLAGGLFFLKPWDKLNNLPFGQLLQTKVPEATQPKFDIRFAKSQEIDPQKGGIIRTADHTGVSISLEIPPNALKEKTKIILIPFLEATGSAAPTKGVIIGPEDVIFNEPVSLSFNFYFSKVKNDAPEKVNLKTPRQSGKSQVLRYSPQDKSLTQVLVARSIESKEVLPARITRGGAYVYSLDSKYQNEFAKATLASDKVSASAKIEAAIALIANKQKLSSEEKEVAKRSIDKIFAKEVPALPEAFAAKVLEDKLSKIKSGLITEAHAAGFNQLVRQYLEFQCNNPRTTIEQLVVARGTAILYGYQDLADKCLEEGKRRMREKFKEALANADSLGEVVDLMQEYNLLGLDEGDTFIEDANNKMNEIIEKNLPILTSGKFPMSERKKAHAALDDVEFIIPGEESKRDKSKDKPAKIDIPGGIDYVSMFKNEPDFDPAIIGLAVAGGLGLTSLDEAGFRNFSNLWAPQAIEATKFATEMCSVVKEEGGFPREIVFDFGDGPVVVPFSEISPEIPPAINKAEGEFFKVCDNLYFNGRAARDIEQWKKDASEFGENIENIREGQDIEQSIEELEETSQYYEQQEKEYEQLEPSGDY